MSDEYRPKKPDDGISDYTGLLGGHHDLKQAERWSRLHNEVMDELTAKAERFPDTDARLLKGFLEIANFMLKNTCGVGSNIRLAECRIEDIDKDKIRKYYTLVLSTLAFHFGQLLPNRREAIWSKLVALCGDEDSCRELACELKSCRDHQGGDFSPVRSGRRLWERTAELLGVKHAETNTPARIYYQTAPGQDLIYLVEQAENEGWFKEE